ncbi:response regulator transcription factor [Campylobacter canadensis]|uniref:Response regulator transcription factor n=1 Tax=Campylobacter canadensis TaxID=449520 RepID=A0ABS7WVY0_9BACT|nr:response regulator transcription factor [Campylobacter canadensis]MBZ7988074.1 response regulator transcription factor [Campylobacter canadensis]MBZ7997314.1 response regulator transcription factor [Campylobacter canadensis]MBZ7999027.1 response regulator transcription factor [Campylobacter canadensis]MBZ8000851.1 response regulator transcription factor [Campylobacter canadensis]MBZ8002664.1 response regulator transcription factor [Campylobacter canadensis]
MKILLLEDDFLYASSIKDYLTSLNYEVTLLADADSACELIASTFFHLYILDVKLLGTNGFEVLKYIKELKITSPIMMMTSLSDINSIKKAYELGCNEYLKKPFELDELKFRINELLSHFYPDINNLFYLKNNYSYDFKNKILKQDDKIIDLTLIELNIIEYLLLNKTRFCKADELFTLVNMQNDESYIRVYIRRIRAKTNENFILSKRGFGYKINE